MLVNGSAIVRLTSEIPNSEIRKIMADDVLSPRKTGFRTMIATYKPTVANTETVSARSETHNRIRNTIK